MKHKGSMMKNAKFLNGIKKENYPKNVLFREQACGENSTGN
jgi:hypothetical protein